MKAAAPLKIPENVRIFFCSDRVIEPARPDMGNVAAVGLHRISEGSRGSSRLQASGLTAANQ